MACLHEQSTSSVEVNRLTDGSGGTVTSYSADIRISCINCGAKFQFVGVPCGFSYGGPACSVDGEELRVPITPPPNAHPG